MCAETSLVGFDLVEYTRDRDPDHEFPKVPASWAYASIQELYDAGIMLDFADGNHGSLYPRKSEFGAKGAISVTAQQINGGRVDLDSAPRLSMRKARALTKR